MAKITAFLGQRVYSDYGNEGARTCPLAFPNTVQPRQGRKRNQSILRIALMRKGVGVIGDIVLLVPALLAYDPDALLGIIGALGSRAQLHP